MLHFSAILSQSEAMLRPCSIVILWVLLEQWDLMCGVEEVGRCWLLWPAWIVLSLGSLFLFSCLLAILTFTSFTLACTFIWSFIFVWSSGAFGSAFGF